ncbi:hypothetical protein DXT96_21105 [Agrobacterium sp. ICMP 6402]|nr:hypothetical protein [Agrobacterium sp. ICMP 6402]
MISIEQTPCGGLVRRGVTSSRSGITSTFVTRIYTSDRDRAPGELVVDVPALDAGSIAKFTQHQPAPPPFDGRWKKQREINGAWYLALRFDIDKSGTGLWIDEELLSRSR